MEMRRCRLWRAGAAVGGLGWGVEREGGRVSTRGKLGTVGSSIDTVAGMMEYEAGGGFGIDILDLGGGRGKKIYGRGGSGLSEARR